MYPADQFPFALLYFTGPASFNFWMRERAFRKGYSLSDCNMVPRHKSYFVSEENQPPPVVCESEEDIFKALELEYIRPEDRSQIREEVLQQSNQLSD